MSTISNSKASVVSCNIETEASKPSTANQPAITNSTDFSQSDALSFLNFRRGEVDARTGSFNYSIPIAKLTGNLLMGPSLELSLRHNHFSDRNEGFGAGWSLGLSRFFPEDSRMKLLLRDGRVMDLELNDGVYTSVTVDIKDFVLTKLDSPANAYQVAYKDGTVETLTAVIPGNSSIFVTEIKNENGCKLTIEYYFTATSTEPFVKRIYDERDYGERDNDLLFITRTGTDTRYNVDIEVYKNTSTITSKLTLVVTGNFKSIDTCQVVLSSTLTIFKFTYESISSRRVITRIDSNSSGPTTEIIEYSSDILLAPPEAPFTTLPAVTSYKFSMVSPGTGNTKTEMHEYSYSTNNFLGYGGVSTWNTDAIDNIYSCPSDYIYSTTETLSVDEVKFSTYEYSYDKFHRLIISDFTAYFLVTPVTKQTVTVNNTYSGNTTLAYADLPLTYKIPTWTQTTYVEEDPDNSHIRTTDIQTQYDDYGNIVSSDEDGGFKLRYYYYPSSGVEGKCPADLHGFIRHLSSTDKYTNDIGIDDIETVYTYTSVRIRDDYDYSYTVLESSKERRVISGFWSQDYKTIINTYYPSEAVEEFNRGMLKNTTLLLSKESGTAANFSYALSESGDEITITTTQTGVDGSQLIYSETVMSLTSWPTQLIDSLGVVTAIGYDPFGRITSITRAQGTEKESVTTYNYNYDPSTLFFSKTTNAPEVNVVTELYDAQSNIVRQVINEQIYYNAEFNTQGQLLSETHYDYDVPLLDGTEGTLTLTDTYQHDAMGNPRTATYHNGLIKSSRFNIGDAELIEYTTVPAQTPHFNYTVTDYDPKIMLPLRDFEYQGDGSTIVMSNSYYYDPFFRIKSGISSDHISDQTVTINYGYDFFDRPNSLTEIGLPDSEVRATTINYWADGLEPKVENIAIDNIVVGYQSYDGLGRIAQEDRNPMQLGQFVTKYQYEVGSTKPSQKTTPRDETILYTYFPELDSLPATITTSASNGNFKYEYNKDTVKLIEETYTIGSTTRTCSIGYDKNLNVTSETVTDSIATGSYNNTFTRTSSGRINTMTRTSAGRPSQTTRYYYDPEGRVAKIAIDHANENDLEVVVTYLGGDLASNVTYNFKRPNQDDIQYKLALSYDYQLRIAKKSYTDNAGNNLAQATEEFSGSGKVIKKTISTTSSYLATTTYSFDYLGRLSKAAISDDSTVYPQDANGNSIKQYEYVYDKFNNHSSCSTTDKTTGTTTTTSFSYAGKNSFELTSISQPDSSITLSYDESGNVTLKSINNVLTHYSYDPFEKLMQIGTSTRNIISLQPNSGGMLGSEMLSTEQGESGQSTSLGYSNSIFDISWRKSAPTATNEQIASYLRTPVNVDVMNVLDGSADTYTKTQALQCSDRLGGVFNTVDSSVPNPAEMVPSLYSPYGYLKDAAAPDSYDPVRFAGAKYDKLTELYHLGNGTRAYDSALMRFMQYDSTSPFGKGGVNPYCYCFGDPITFSDPSGQGRDVAIMFASLGLVFSIITLGIGALSIIGAAPILLSGALIAGSVIGASAAATGLGAAITEDEEISQQLATASQVLGTIALVLDLFPIAIFAGHRITWRLVQRFTTGRVLQVNTGFQKFYPGANYKISGKFTLNGGDTRMVKAHGGVDIMTQPLQRSNTHWMDSPVSVEGFANRTRDILENPINHVNDLDSAIFLAACGGTKAGARSNAQNIATFMQRTVYAFPASKVLTYQTGSISRGTVTAFGTPWFMKLKTFHY